MIRCFEIDKGVNVKISSMNFGPYDNGHIILGLSNGSMLIMNSLDLSMIFRIKIFESCISKIVFEPTNMIILSSNDCEPNDGLSSISLI